MRPGQQQQQNKRMRGRGRKGPNPLSRSYESNGPDVKIRGTAQHVAEKYSTLARDAAASGDRVMAENYLQHAEHYGRIVAAAQGTFQLQQDENDFSDQNDEDGDEDGGQDAGYAAEQSYQPPVRAPQDRGHQDRNGFDRSQGERNQPAMRDGQPANRENQPAVRDHREQPQNGNRDQRAGNRDGRDGNRDLRNGNRDGNRDNREFNRDGRDNRGNFQNRDNQPGRDQQPREGHQHSDRERPAPVGLGPQPFLPETSAPGESVQSRRPEVPRDQPRQPSAAEPVVAREEFRPRGDEPRPEGEPRRRGRPRRIRIEDAAAGYAAVVSEPKADAAPVTEAPRQPVAEHPAAASVVPVPSVAAAPEARTEAPQVSPGIASDPEAKIKRKPGRPRKKKPEDGGPDGGGGEHLPAFLMASNG